MVKKRLPYPALSEVKKKTLALLKIIIVEMIISHYSDNLRPVAETTDLKTSGWRAARSANILRSTSIFAFLAAEINWE